MAKHQLLLLCCLCFAVLHAAQEQLETGLSDGRSPAAATSWTVKRNRCQPGAFIHSWIVGEGDILGSYAGSPQSVVSIQAKCSDGAILDSLAGSTPPARKQDSDSNSALLSAMGYHCSMLVEGSYNNNGGSRMVSFLKVGQNPADPGATPIKLNCSGIPASYVAVGYSGAAEDAVGGVNFLMAPFPQQPLSANKSSTADPTAPAWPHQSPSTNNSTTPDADGDFDGAPGPETKAQNSSGLIAPAAAAASAPARVEPAAVVAPPAAVPASATGPQGGDSGLQLTLAMKIGIATSSLVGVSALLTIAYNVWRWKNKLVKAKGSSNLGPMSSAPSAIGTEKPSMV
jgi:hypothetical protein